MAGTSPTGRFSVSNPPLQQIPRPGSVFSTLTPEQRRDLIELCREMLRGA